MLTYFEAPKSTLIYIFRINDEAHANCLKIGETSLEDDQINAITLRPNSKVLNDSARKRIDQYTKTAGICYELLHTESSLYVRGKGFGYFNDKEVHQVLLRSGIRRKEFRQGTHSGGTEWFETDLGTAIQAIKAVKEGRQSLSSDEITTERSPIIFRPEQREAIDKTLKRFKHGTQMLWNAKMRFGKTLSALQVARELNAKRTLILTHRPVVDSGWFEDFGKIFYDRPAYRYGSKNKGESFENLEKLHLQQGVRYVYFASMQDLRGSETVGGKFDKNDAIFATPWDLLIIDEAHEGTQTPLGQAVLQELTKNRRTKVLQLSGTPFNLIDNFDAEEVYTWDYVMEQQAKANWEQTRFGDPNPYAGLPRLNIFTYDLGKELSDYTDEAIAFNFREFFRVTEHGDFVHQQDILAFLNLLTRSDATSHYPFSCDRYRTIFRHTLWVLPGVQAAKALSQLLKTHPIFQHFQVINVAGEGDQDQERSDALTLVEEAIGDDPDLTRTITLTCGRLTTGVSVKAWTGVFMLAGSYNTKASAYMQTIFRVQTPATINGRIKEECYVFDFAPDRALQVLATVPKLSIQPGKTTHTQKKALGNFLNFCPVISISGSKMESLNVTRMLQQLKNAYIERAVHNGFDDSSLYNDQLLTLTEPELQDFIDLKGIIGSTKSIGNPGSIDINSQGLTNEEYEENNRLTRKKKKELTEAERARLEELNTKKKIRKDAISILRGISIRMPLLIYGADIQNEDEELTIDNFTTLIDPQSWEEFMPKGVTKQKFDTFKKYYDPEIFAAAGKRIRAIARAADKQSIEERINRLSYLFSTFRNPDKETVLTPWRVVNLHMGETLGGYNFFTPDYEESLESPRYIDRGAITRETFTPGSLLLEINSKSGLYPLYLTYNLYRATLRAHHLTPATPAEHQAIWDQIVAENIYIICKTPMAKSITRRTLLGFRSGHINTRHFEDLINQIKNKPTAFISKITRGRSFWKAHPDDHMKFNAVVGNPPYQEEGISTRKTPIYHLFYDIAFKLSSKVTLITPGRFLFRAGQTPKDWTEKILSDKHFKVVKYYRRSSDIFPNVDIKGGVVIAYRDAELDFGKNQHFTGFSELSGILEKVHRENSTGKAFTELISSQGIYRFTDVLFQDYPRIAEVQGKGTASKITSNSLEKLTEVFLEKPICRTKSYIAMVGRCSGKRVIRWIEKQYIQNVSSLNKYKVFVPEANGTGAIGEIECTPVIGIPILGLPEQGATDTFLSVGAFESKREAEHCLKYICTKFARTLLGTLKATQHNPRDTWSNVPMQDFTEHSDINWDCPVRDIDSQLYKKYGLNIEEITFIETNVKAMSPNTGTDK